MGADSPSHMGQKRAPSADKVVDAALNIESQGAVPPPKAEPADISPPASLVPNSARGVNRPLPAKSVQEAVNAFKNFSLSCFAKTSIPPNYVPAAQAKSPSVVMTVLRKSMTAQTAKLAANPPGTPGLTVALTAASLRKLLPSLDTTTGTVQLSELLGALKQNLRGTEFYASGNPTLNRVVRNSGLLSQVQAFIGSVKAGAAGNVAAAVTPEAPAEAAAAQPAVNLGAGSQRTRSVPAGRSG